MTKHLFNRDFSQAKSLKDDKKVMEVLNNMEQRVAYLDGVGQHRYARIFEHAVRQAVENNNYDYIKAISNCERFPVTIEEFVTSKEFLGDIIQIWPTLLDELKAFKPDIMAGKDPIFEVLNMSAIGTGKTIIGQVSTMYDIYFLTCFKSPQGLYPSLNKYTPIVIVLQSIREGVTNRVLFNPLRDMFTNMPHTKKWIDWNRDKESVLELEKRIILQPMIASTTTILGQAVIGAHLDEANFMQVINESKKATGPDGLGGLYDQAGEVYTAVSLRRRSRFITNGPNPGLIYVSSSVNYNDDFLARRIRQLDQEADKHVHVINYKQSDVKPHVFSGETFRFLVGSSDYPPKMLSYQDKAGLDYPIDGVVEDVPIEFLDNFRLDPDKAQRDILNVASSAINRYIGQTNKIVEAITRWKESTNKPLVEKENVVLA